MSFYFSTQRKAAFGQCGSSMGSSGSFQNLMLLVPNACRGASHPQISIWEIGEREERQMSCLAEVCNPRGLVLPAHKGSVAMTVFYES